MEDVAVTALERLIDAGLAMSALVVLSAVLAWLLAQERKDHKLTREDLKESNSDVRSLSERALTAIAGLRESINDFMRRQ